MIEGVSRVAVVGTGTIGASWAAYFLARGLDVAAADPAPGAEAFLRRYVEEAWPALERLGLAPGADPARLAFHGEALERACEGAGFCQENGPEREAVKVELFARVDAAMPPGALIASSSSTLLVTAMQARCAHPERCVLGHPFNPPHLIPLVEVVGGERTAPEAVERAMAFYRTAGKHPIQLRKEMPGHVSNRLQAAIWREAAYLVEQGVVSVADVDAAVSMGPGLRWAIMGPIMTYNLGGGEGGLRYLLDHIGVAQLWPELGTPEMTRAFEDSLIAGVTAEADGRSIPELARERDRKLLGILGAVGGQG
jgi:3-hydroxyacyl-CoA dehydrogenase